MSLFRLTAPKQNLGGVMVAAGFLCMAVGGRYLGRAITAGRKAAAETRAQQDAINAGAAAAEASAAGGAAGAGGVFGSGLLAKRFYEGGFEQTMSKREAALILGCRESATRERIMERYRTMIRLNHPDMGGSPLLATKINEAKNLLFPRARSDPNSVKPAAQRRARPARPGSDEQQQ